MERTYIGMGSNLADPAEQLRSAVEALAQLPDSRLVGVAEQLAFHQLGGQRGAVNGHAGLFGPFAPDRKSVV